MQGKLLHIFRNTPFGRETLLHSLHLTRTLGLELNLYVPRDKKFLMYFEHDAVEVDLDSSYLRGGDTVDERLAAILEDSDVQWLRIMPEQYTASNLPDIPTDFAFMTCPRVISDLSSKVGLGHIGSKVRRILQCAQFPVLVTSPGFKPFQSVAVLFGGSENSVRALRLGLSVSREGGVPLDVYTQVTDQDAGGFEAQCRAVVEGAGLTRECDEQVRSWRFFGQGEFVDNLFAVPYDALVVLGAYGHGMIRDMMFGTTAEMVQSTLPNPLLVVGPNYRPVAWRNLSR